MSGPLDRPVLLLYDGSDEAAYAIEQAGEVLGAAPAIAVCIWESIVTLTLRYPAIGTMISADAPQADAAEAERAAAVAAEGAELGRRAGFDARPEHVETTSQVWARAISLADERDARAIVAGSRGLTGVRSLWLGSVSRPLVEHARRPVLIVPSRELAAARERAEAQAPAGP